MFITYYTYLVLSIMKRFFEELNAMDSEILPTIKKALIDFAIVGLMFLATIGLGLMCLMY